MRFAKRWFPTSVILAKLITILLAKKVKTQTFFLDESSRDGQELQANKHYQQNGQVKKLGNHANKAQTYVFYLERLSPYLPYTRPNKQ